jgi:hypothetical protein
MELGGHFEAEDGQFRNPFAKNPGVNAAISDPPPDMKLKPPLRGEVDHRPTGNPVGRNSQYDEFVPSMKKPQNLSHGDYLKGRNPNW